MSEYTCVKCPYRCDSGVDRAVIAHQQDGIVLCVHPPTFCVELSEPPAEPWTEMIELEDVSCHELNLVKRGACFRRCVGRFISDMRLHKSTGSLIRFDRIPTNQSTLNLYSGGIQGYDP